MKLTAFALLLAMAGPAGAVSDPAEMLPNPVQEARAARLGRELRCLVCQNESIEDSGADLARDLRAIVRQRVAAGDSDADVTGWLVARYGNFVRLRPVFDAQNALLWLSPLLALAAGLGAAVWSRRRPPPPPAPLTDDERRHLDQLTTP